MRRGKNQGMELVGNVVHSLLMRTSEQVIEYLVQAQQKMKEVMCNVQVQANYVVSIICATSLKLCHINIQFSIEYHSPCTSHQDRAHSFRASTLFLLLLALLDLFVSFLFIPFVIIRSYVQGGGMYVVQITCKQVHNQR